MRNIIISIIIVLSTSVGAYADCVATTKTYTSCKPGYYKSGSLCSRCPKDSKSGEYGTTADKNTGGMETCYIPSGTSFSDSTGSGVYAGDCKY